MDQYENTPGFLLWRRWSRGPVVAVSLSAIVAIVAADKMIEPNVSLGVLYFLPLVLLAVHASRLQLLAACLVCAVLREVFGPFVFNSETIPRFVLVLTSYSGVGLFVNQLVRSRRDALAMLDQIRAEAIARRKSEARLQAILDSTPVGVLVLNPHGSLLVANHTAKQLLALPESSNQNAALGEIKSYIPALVNFLDLPPVDGGGSVVVELPAWRSTGDQFLARFWIARCITGPEPITAVAFTDISEQVRDAELAGLDNLIAGSRIVLGAVSHEIRNLAAAIGVEARNIGRSGAAGAGPLLTLAAGLEQLAASQLQTVRPRFDARADVVRVVNEAAVITAPEFLDCGSGLRIEPHAQDLWARTDYHGLLQVLLNLLNNAARQCAAAGPGEFCRVSLSRNEERIFIRIFSPGEPLPDPERMFKPFAPDASGTGLGLYVSRSILRSFGGDLRYDTGSDGPCFVMELAACPNPALRD
jgi:two-component system sensor kinase FixL